MHIPQSPAGVEVMLTVRSVLIRNLHPQTVLEPVRGGVIPRREDVGKDGERGEEVLRSKGDQRGLEVSTSVSYPDISSVPAPRDPRSRKERTACKPTKLNAHQLGKTLGTLPTPDALEEETLGADMV